MSNSEQPCYTNRILIFGGSGGLGTIVAADLSKDYQVRSLDSSKCNLLKSERICEVIDDYKPDTILSFVGVNNNAPLHKLDITKASVEIDTMIEGHVAILRYCLPMMREAGYGRVIFASSVLARKIVFGTGTYAMIKCAIERLVIQAAYENGGKGITVNALRLGYFNAGIINEVPDKMLDDILSEVPSKHLGDPKEIPAMIRSVLSSSYINGSIIDMDGGIK